MAPPIPREGPMLGRRTLLLGAAAGLAALGLASCASPGAANGVVLKNGIGMAFWMAGVPGSADIVKVEVPSTMAAGISRCGILAARNSAWAIGASTKNATNRLTPP